MTVIERDGSRWSQRECRAGEHVTVASVPLEVSVDEIYAGVDLRPAAD